jgi:hypothetical protein
MGDTKIIITIFLLFDIAHAEKPRFDATFMIWESPASHCSPSHRAKEGTERVKLWKQINSGGLAVPHP